MSAAKFSLTLPLMKIDEERRLIFARGAQEIKDKAGEIMDYATAKPEFQAWSDAYVQRTSHLGPEGLSKGNIRAMHNKQHASGKVVDLSFDDDDKAVDLCLKIVDDGDWAKCLSGVYTGLSVGGGYRKKWKDNGLVKYTPIPREFSLVDDPCVETAVFAELIKMNGAVEQLQLRGVVRTFADMWASRPVEPPSFADVWAARPMTFAELNKGFPSIPNTEKNIFGQVVARVGFKRSKGLGKRAGFATA